MASSINGASITSTAGSPTVRYDVGYTASRSSNTTVTYKFNIDTSLVYSGSYIYNGYKLTLYITVNGVKESVVLKEDEASWSGAGKKSSKTLSVTTESKTGSATQTVTFQVVNKGTLDGSAGEIYTTDYYVTSPALITTDCTAPTTFTASPSTFEDDVTLSWSGAKGGTNNSIKEYQIYYRTSSDNKTWGSGTHLQTTDKTSYTVDMSSKVSRGKYVQFSIRTLGSAGNNYYSDFKYSNSIRRNPYTKCTAPTTLTVSPNNFEDDVTIQWSGASGGTNNSINSYLIRYRTKSDASGASFGSWQDLKTISTNKISGSVTTDMSSIVSRGYYVEFAIRTQGSAGSSYYSGWQYSDDIQRIKYTKCSPPTSIILTSAADLQGNTHNDIFDTEYTISWSGAKGGTNNSITGYKIEFQESSTTTFDSTWTNWFTKQTTATSGSHTYDSTMDRGKYLRIRIATVGSVDGYNSSYIVSEPIRRNSVPSKIASISVNLPSLEYSYGDDIVLTWQKPQDVDNNIHKYYISLYQNTTPNASTATWSKLLTDEVIGANNLTYTFQSSNAIYQSIANNQQIRFSVSAEDIFGLIGSSKSSNAITRCDLTGVSIGMNGKWVICQLFVGRESGRTSEWVEQDVYAGINGSWIQGGNE